MSFRILIELASQLQGKGFTDAAKGLADTDSKARKLSLSVGEVGSMVRKLAVALTGGAFATFIKQSINIADELAKDAQAAGQTVTAFSSLAYAGDLSRASTEQLIQASKGLSQWLDKTGQSTVSLTQALLQQADVFAAMPDGPEKVRLANERFGRGAQQLIPLLNSGSEAIRENMREAQLFGLTMGPRFTGNAQTFNDNITRIQKILRGMGNMIADRILPALIGLTEKFINFVKETGANKAVVEGIIQLFKGFAITANTAYAAVAALGAVTGAFFGSMSQNLDPIEAITAALAAYSKEMSEALERQNAITDSMKEVPEDPMPDPARTKEWASELKNLQIALEQNQTILEKVENDQSSTVQEKTRELEYVLEKRKKLLSDYRDALMKSRGVSMEDIRVNASGMLEFSEAAADVAHELETILRLLDDIDDKLKKLKPEGFFKTFSDEIKKLTDEFNDLGASVAKTLVDGVRGAIRVVSEGIWDVIDGTATWGDLFRQVGRQIISGLIQIAIQEIFLDNLKKTLLVGWAAMKAAFTAKDVAASNAAEAAKTPALATNATLASISSWGIAVAIGVAAIAGIMASMGAFERGGVVEGGEQIIRVNESGTEAVLNAGATARIGRAGIDAINSGMPFLAPGTGNRVTSALTNALGMESAMAAAVAVPSAVVGSGAVSGAYPTGSAPATGGASGAGQPIQLTLVIVDDRNSQAALDAIASSAGQALIVKAVKDQKMQVGIRA